MAGGTVRYHHAELSEDGSFWRVWFTEDALYPIGFPVAEGEAMGLTPPEPAPLVVECNGHRIELSDEDAAALADVWEMPVASDIVNPYNRALTALGGLLRDARQDPQPASDDSEPWPWGDEGYMCPKMLRETMCVAQGVVSRSPDTDVNRRMEHVKRIQRVIEWCDRHRPIGPNGKHGTNRCTPTCGCEDKREPITPVQPAPLSPGECLRGLLAGHTDADELIEYAAEVYTEGLIAGPLRPLLFAVGDAAREVHG